MERLLARNIKLLYLFKVIKNFLIIMPIIVPFFQSRDLSQFEIFLLESTWALSILLFEIPSGYFADKAGRKLSILIGSAIGSVAYSIYTFGDSFYVFLAANFLLGISFSFISGADSALAYESFKLLKREDEYLNFESRRNGTSGFFQIIASLVGGGLAAFSIVYPVYAQVIIYSLLIPTALFLTEATHSKELSPLSLKEVLKQIWMIFSSKESPLKVLIVYFVLVGNMTHTIAWIAQPFFQSLGIAIKWFGVIWAIQYIFYSIFSRSSEKIAEHFGKKNSLIFFLIISTISYFLIGILNNFAAIAFIFIIYCVRGAFKPMVSDSIHYYSESKIRATVFSIESFFRKFAYMLIGPVIGFITDSHGISMAFISSGIIYGIFGIWLITKLLKYKF